jgi:hypothetical protein
LGSAIPVSPAASAGLSEPEDADEPDDEEKDPEDDD